MIRTLLRGLALRLYAALIPEVDREWLRALVAELPAVEARGRLAWLLGAVRLLAGALLGRFATDGWLMAPLLLFSLILARLHLESGPMPEPSGGFFLTRLFDPPEPGLYSLWLAAAVGLIALLRAGWSWRWGLLAGLALPVWVYVLSVEGRYAYDRFDAFYPLAATMPATLIGSFLRGRVLRQAA
jgi:hypothetical protein